MGQWLLPDSQCGFEKRLCGHDFFVARQLMEKTSEHEDSLFFLMFVDLKKAYYSVPRNVLWTVLAKWCAPYNAEHYT